jgi:GTP-binding protein EngB required for normal cell division
MKTELLQAWHRATFREETQSILALREVFSLLDPVRDILPPTLSDWEPPQIVVLGQESTGKSSLLERLTMMPLFPRADGICTRVPIHLKMRNAAVAQAPTLEVLNMRTGALEDGPWVVPIEWGAMEVRALMGEVLAREEGRSSQGVSADRAIVVHMEGPLVPSLDLVDLPGLVAAPQDAAAATSALVERYAAEREGGSLFLVVVPATDNPRNSAAMALVERLGLQGRALGVLTMCDEAPPRRMAGLRRHLGLPDDQLAQPSSQGSTAGGGGMLGDDVALLPHGWVAVSNRPADADADDEAAGGGGSRERLRRQAAAERQFFAGRLPGAAKAGLATCDALVRLATCGGRVGERE